MLAEQSGGDVVWRHEDAQGGSVVGWDKGLNFIRQEERDPTGVDVGASNPFAGVGGGEEFGVSRVSLIPEDPSGRCRHDGAPIHCARLKKMLAMDSAVIDTMTTVTIRRASGKVETYSGEAGLPEGYGARFTGLAAGVAASAFGLYREEGFGRAALMTVVWGRMAGGGGTDAGGTGSAALFFAPQNSGLQFLQDPSGGSYGTGKENAIRAIVNGMRSDSCTKAFEDAGLTPPKELLEKGVVIGPATLLSGPSPENLKYMGITEYARNRDVRMVGSNWIRAVVIRDHPRKNPDTTDGRPRIFLNTSAFSGLGDYLRHEFIHAGGADAVPNFIGSDLEYLGWKRVRVGNGFKGEGIYALRKTGPSESDIIEACR